MSPTELATLLNLEADVACPSSRLAQLSPVLRATVEVARIEADALSKALQRLVDFRAQLRRETTLKAFGIRPGSRLVNRRSDPGWIYLVTELTDEQGSIMLEWTGERRNPATHSTPFLPNQMLVFEDISRPNSQQWWEVLTY